MTSISIDALEVHDKILTLHQFNDPGRLSNLVVVVVRTVLVEARVVVIAVLGARHLRMKSLLVDVYAPHLRSMQRLG